MGEIPKEDYDLTKTKLDRDLDHLNVEISKLEKNPRTITENGALTILHSLSSTYKNGEKEKTGKSCDFSGLVDQTLRISNLSFLEGLLEIQRFIDHILHQ